MPEKTFDSTSDQRVVNNVMRHEYKHLDEIGKERMKKIKDLGLEFHDYLHSIGGTAAGSSTFASRDLALAGTHIEDAVMRAVRHITG
jgi:hypothetical protein